LERFRRLAEGTGLKIEGVYRMHLSRETVKANAMLAGLGRTRRVILGDTLLDGFSPDEIAVVLAHEIGHHVFRHIGKFLLAGFALSFAAFALCDAVLRYQVGRYEGSLRYDVMPVWTLPWILLTVGLLSTLLAPLHNFVSRRFERQCDRYALEKTGLREAFCSAFRKLAVLNKADLHPHPLEVFLFHDHPPIAERLAIAEESRIEELGI
jgi:STE24 endopeptidase